MPSEHTGIVKENYLWKVGITRHFNIGSVKQFFFGVKSSLFTYPSV